MKRIGRDRFQASLLVLLDAKQDVVEQIPARMGRYNDKGKKEVEVKGRINYSWVRLRGDDSEAVQAFNDKIGNKFGYPVIVVKDLTYTKSYRIIDRDSSRLTVFQSNPLARHGRQHSFATPGDAANDIVWIYKRQMIQPLLCHPQPTTPNMTTYVEPDFYYWAGQFKYFAGGSSLSMSPYIPTLGYQRFVLVYLDGGTGTIKLLVGTPFSSIYGPSSGTYISAIPEINPSIGLPLAAALLSSTTTVVNWSNLFDVRIMLFSGGGLIPGAHGLDPVHGFHTGQLRSTYIDIVDTNNHFASGQLEGALDELFLRFSPYKHQLNVNMGAPGPYHSGALEAFNVRVADPTDVFIHNELEGVLTELYTQASPLTVQKAGSTVGVRNTLNLIQGTNVSMTVVDNVGANRVDVTISSTGGGSSTEPLANGDPSDPQVVFDNGDIVMVPL